MQKAATIRELSCLRVYPHPAESEWGMQCRLHPVRLTCPGFLRYGKLSFPKRKTSASTEPLKKEQQEPDLHAHDRETRRGDMCWALGPPDPDSEKPHADKQKSLHGPLGKMGWIKKGRDELVIKLVLHFEPHQGASCSCHRDNSTETITLYERLNSLSP